MQLDYLASYYWYSVQDTNLWLNICCCGLDVDLLLLVGGLWLAPSLPFSSGFSWWLVILLLVRD
jgi:hypothetical protein